jgi:hypothetical protein
MAAAFRSADRSGNATIFEKSDDAAYLHRRLRERGLDILDHLCNTTVQWAAQNGTQDQWHLYWRLNLPSIAYNNRLVQEMLAEEFVKDVPDVEKAALVAYQLYCKHTYGRAANGNINILEFTCPPFHEFYHAFLTRLSADRSVVKLDSLGPDNRLHIPESVTRDAVLDALRDVLRHRLTIKSSMTKEEHRAKAALEKSAKEPAAAAAVPVHSAPKRRSPTPPADRESRGSDTYSRVSTLSTVSVAASAVRNKWIENLDKKAGQSSVVSARHDTYAQGGVKACDSASQIVTSRQPAASPAPKERTIQFKERTIQLTVPQRGSHKSSDRASISKRPITHNEDTSSSSSESSSTSKEA